MMLLLRSYICFRVRPLAFSQRKNTIATLPFELACQPAMVQIMAFQGFNDFGNRIARGNGDDEMNVILNPVHRVDNHIKLTGLLFKVRE